MMKMLYATLLSLLIASASAQSHNITISSATSGKCLEVRDFAHVKSGSAVQINDCNDSVAQVWSYYYRGDARAQIRLGYPGPNFCLDAVNVLTSNKVVIRECDQSLPQQWTFTKNGLTLVNNEDLCLDVPNSSTKNGVQVQTYTCPNQEWRTKVLDS